MNINYVQVTGGCFCGAVRYKAEANLDEAYYCHCKTCQKTSGAPAEIAVFVKPGSMEFVRGEPRFYQTSPFGRRGFCSECGSRLMWMSPDKADWTNVSIGSLDDPEHVVPVEHNCVESQLPWYRVAEELPHLRSEDDPELMSAWAGAGMSHDGSSA
ncbi:MAG: GFA family protein [Pseudomonadales bacterium]